MADPEAHEAVIAALSEAKAELDIATGLIAQAAEAQSRALASLHEMEQLIARHRLSALPPSDQAPSEHRKQHRPGRQAKIEGDPELRAFIRARIDRQTFTEIANDIARHFPPARQVRKSAIHSWWTSTQKRR